MSDMLRRRDLVAQVGDSLATTFAARNVLLTDSGTSALVLALRALVGPDGIVAMPAYACVDLVAAARCADVRVRFFDLDPNTLSPDMDSLQRIIDSGVSAIVVAHLYGFPADMPAVMSAARVAGIPVIEDAAQHACATIAGRRAGSFGDLAVLSFGRGKGTTSGRGGALLTSRNAELPGAVPNELEPGHSGFTDLTLAWASWMLGRPSIYGIPAAIPALHLGETVYHEAGEPAAMSHGAVALLDRTLRGMDNAARVRRENAAILASGASQSRHVKAIEAIDGATSGYLRFPVLLRGELRDDPKLGIAHGYPTALPDETPTQPILVQSSDPLHGARELARRLVTLPTHHMVASAELAQLSNWLRDE
jgi:dTDP-4-amino-4,6-dideoxygalactose transaminase